MVKLDSSSFKLMLEILASFSGDPTLTVPLSSVGAGLVKVFVATGVSFDAGKVGCVRNSMCLFHFTIELHSTPS